MLLKSYINNLQDKKTKDTICNGGTVWHKYKFESKPLRLVNFEVDEYEVVRNGWGGRMKTKEFIEKVEKLGFTIEYYKNPFSNIKSNCDYDLITISANNQVLVKIWTNCQYAISTISDGHSCYLYGYDVDELYKVCFEYANTPSEDREEEKKYYLKHRFLTSLLRDMKYSFINYDTKYNDIYLSSNEALDYVKTKFTLKEIEEIKKKFDTDLADFELVEVEDEKV